MRNFKKGDEIPKDLVEVSEGFIAKFGCDVAVIGAVIICKTDGSVIQVESKSGNYSFPDDWAIKIKAHQIIGCDSGINSGIHWTCKPCKMSRIRI